MRILVTVCVAAAFVLGTAAQAAPFVNYFGVETLDATTAAPAALGEHPYHPCHGRTTGTADAACGTLTGGPSGGLF